MNVAEVVAAYREPWNKGKLVGQKAPLRLRDIWAIRIRIQLAGNIRDLALFTLAIDSKLRACDLVKLRVRDIAHGDHIARRAIVLQQKTLSPVQFEITEQTRTSVTDWIKHASLHSECYLFRTRQHQSPHLSTRQYARIADRWIGAIGLARVPTARTQCAEPKPLWSIGARRTCARCNCCRGTPGSRAPPAVWVSKSTMPWRWRNRAKCELDWFPCRRRLANVAVRPETDLGRRGFAADKRTPPTVPSDGVSLTRRSLRERPDFPDTAPLPGHRHTGARGWVTACSPN